MYVLASSGAMRITRPFLALCALWSRLTFALLEEKFVSFSAGNGTLNIVGATVLADADDFVGVHIALRSLVADLEQITGTKPLYWNYTANATVPDTDRSIIVGSVNSTLIRALAARGILEVSDIDGKWEVFKTAVVENPIAGVSKALVITGSDKRGTIFGAHTLAEQCGQSP
jgi:hypothetical protein